jgi:hypothetical protein
MTNGKGNKAVVGGKELEGTLFDTPELLLDTMCFKDDSHYHGTHVAGCAAASPVSTVNGVTGGSLAGMAPKAELIFCNVAPDDAQTEKYDDTDTNPETLNTMYSLNYIADYAQKAGKPFMVTMSMNTHNGTHDGTSGESHIYKEFCDRGYVMTISTGNEGDEKCHVHKTVDGEHPLKVLSDVRSDFSVFNFLFTDEPAYIRFFVYDEDKEMELATTAFHELKNGLFSKALLMDGSEDVGTDALSADLRSLLLNRYTSLGGGLMIVNGIGSGEAPNGSPRVMTQTVIQSKGKFNFIQQQLGIEIRSSVAAEERGWIEGAEFLNLEGFDQASSDVSVGELNTTDVPIGVGAWTASNLIVDEPGEEPEPDEDFSVGEVAPFSSYGTDYAGHNHPFVVAPGVCIYSTANSFFEDGRAVWVVAGIAHRGRHRSTVAASQARPDARRCAHRYQEHVACHRAYSQQPLRSRCHRCIRWTLQHTRRGQRHPHTEQEPACACHLPPCRKRALCRWCRRRHARHRL